VLAQTKISFFTVEKAEIIFINKDMDIIKKRGKWQKNIERGETKGSRRQALKTLSITSLLFKINSHQEVF